MSAPRCWLAPFSPAPCAGELVRVHLIEQQRLRHEFPYGVIDLGDGWQRKPRTMMFAGAMPPVRGLRTLQDDSRTFVWGCGGAMGLEGHHGMLDGRTLPRLVLARGDLPGALEEFAAEYGLGWWLDRRYGVRVDDGSIGA